MSVEVTRLENGLTVVTDSMPHLQTTSVGVWVNTGARHERAREHGVSHMLEHMAFKGTERRSALAIAEEIETVGGHLNAHTTHEATAYYARVLREDLPLAVDAGFSPALLAKAAAALLAESPHVNLRIRMMHEARIMDEVLTGRARIGIVSLEAGLSGKEVDGRDIATHEMHTVAAPGHPLARAGAPFPLSALDDHRQIVVAGGEAAANGFDYRVHTTDVLIVDNAALKLELLKAGAGWAFALDHEVGAALKEGSLLSLDCTAIRHPGLHRFGAIWRVTTPPGRAAGRLLDLLSQEAGKAEAARKVGPY